MPKPTSVASVADAAYMEAVTLSASGLDAVERLHDRDPEPSGWRIATPMFEQLDVAG